ncbi:MAG: LptA/OstA family protein [Woeseiaceae bacterium]|nr:LptA/OstA family protein [Woeseiaceae bacterium]
MSSSTRILQGLLVWIAIVPAAVAQVVDLDQLQLPWTLDSETAVFDGKTSTYIYTGLRFSQGSISIESDEGRMTNGLENERHLRFSGNVVIVVNNGRIECDDAVLKFQGTTLSNAVVTGSPATYELRRAGAEDVTYAEAGRLLYDVGGGVIEFSDNAKITESGNEIASNFLLYNINERRIKADSTGADDDRVRITYTPTNGTPEPETAPEDDSQ